MERVRGPRLSVRVPGAGRAQIARRLRPLAKDDAVGNDLTEIQLSLFELREVAGFTAA